MRYTFSAGIILALSLMAFSIFHEIRVIGIVKDENGFPITGVSVSEKLNHQVKHNLTYSGTDGKFSLLVSTANPVLVFNLKGYEQLEFQVKDPERPIQIVLKAATQSLSEVEIIGYGIQRKKDITGSVTTIYDKSYSASPIKPSSQREKLRAGYSDSKSKYFQPEEDSARFNTEEYDQIVENRFLTVNENPLSTFSIDVDGGSYSNARRYLQQGQMPPPGAVRIEEFINYFHYDYPQPREEAPFSINTEIGECSWSPHHKLVMIGLQGKKIPTDKLPPSNLVFLIDVSGSMMEPEKLPLVQRSLNLLVDQLREQDRVSLVVYAGNAGLVLPSTSGSEKIKIKDAINRLEAGGSTAGGAGILLAYRVAEKNFVRGGNNRVILCTDGDFNVGASSDAALGQMIEKERETGVFLTVLGFGMGNYKDSKMEKLADQGNGNHAYIDNENEAKKVLVREFGGTLFTIAKDVKLQLEFNPAKIQAYRLIGYENRMLSKEDFNNDARDAGEMGSGHTVTALYEVIPAGEKNEFLENVDALKYQKNATTTPINNSSELLTIKFRYKNPDGDKSMLLQRVVYDRQTLPDAGSVNFRFVSAVAEFGMLLRNSSFRQQSSYKKTIALAKNALGNDTEGYRTEFLQLVRSAGKLADLKNPEMDDEELSRVK
jgi:Ca-activated chloride channel homolog